MDGVESYLGNHQGRATYVRQVDGDSDMVLLHCGYVSGRAQKRNNSNCLHFCLGKSCTPALALVPDTSVSPSTLLVPFKVLPLCWSPEVVSLSKCACRSLQEEMTENPQFLPQNQPHPPHWIYSQRLWGLIFLALEPWDG